MCVRDRAPPRPKCSASEGVTNEAIAMSFMPREADEIVRLKHLQRRYVHPNRQIAIDPPCVSRKAILGSSVSSPSSFVTSNKRPSCSPRAATVIAIRTAAASRVAFVQG